MHSNYTSMKKLYLMMSVLLACGLFCACSDEEDIVVDNYDATYQVKYYNLDPDLYKTQRRWYYDKPIEMYPQKEPPYTLMVKWDSDEGKQALDYIVGKNDGVVTNRYDHDYENMSIIVCNKYISCPYLYVSSSYKESESFLYENEFVRIDNKILLKMKDGKSVDPIVIKYTGILVRYTGEEKVRGTEIFDCTLKTSCEVLRLAEEIQLRDDVEWAEPNMYAPIHYDI